jgi:aldose 1-epimerase
MSFTKSTRRQLLTGVVGAAAAAPAALALTRSAEANNCNGNHPDDFLPAGRHHTIKHHDQEAIIVDVGAALRSYKVGEWDFIWGFTEQEYAFPGTRGSVLSPWPGEVINARYTFDGVQQVLPINFPGLPPGRNNAHHGLIRWSNFEVIRKNRRSLTIHKSPGYPFVILIRQHYVLSTNGLTVIHRATNKGSERAPYGVGSHPYLRVDDTIDTCVLQAPGQSYVPLAPVTFAPLPPVPVDGTPLDFRTPRPIGPNAISNPTTDLMRDADGIASVVLENASGTRRITMWLNEAYQFLWIFAAAPRQGLSLEPYSCNQDAFNNGMGLRILEPGQTFEARWGLEVTTT